MDSKLYGESLREKEKRLARAERDLMAQREALEKERNAVTRRSLRDNLYSRINVSVKTMDKVILALSAALCLALVVGIVMR